MFITPEDATLKVYDYIIIGGGTAGLMLAASLTEDPGTAVLVLEAGSANLNDPDILRPASYGSHFANNEHVWSHKTVKQPHTHSREHFWHRGKGLGGSSAINFSIYTKPTKEEVDDLERLGNPGWNWDSFQKALNGIEGFVEPPSALREKFKIPNDTETVGRNGPVKIAYPGFMQEAESQVQQTFINAGIPLAAHPLSGDPRGAYLTPNLVDPATHTRSYAATAFYLPNQDRQNLHVLLHAHAWRIATAALPDGRLKAHGVEFLHDGQLYAVHAVREVIVSAGTVRSPQILELSGIGRREVLESISVPVKLELFGVGENLQEHVVSCVAFELEDSVAYDTLELRHDPVERQRQLGLHAKGTGIFTTGMTSMAFVSPQVFTPRAAELHEKAKMLYAAIDPKIEPGLSAQYKMMMDRLELDSQRSGPGCQFIVVPGVVQLPATYTPGTRYVSFNPTMNYQWSRGSVHCSTSDPLKDPDIDPHYFEHSIDLDIFVETVKFARHLGQVSPLKDMIKKEVLPGPGVTTDEELRDWLRESCISIWHSAGTCSMMPRASGGVVDPNLKVYGTSNIRVVDLSVLPLQAATHPMSFVYAIATRAAAFIKIDREEAV